MYQNKNLNQKQCPVCGKNPSSEYVVEHHKMRFHFCSEQCRENFQAHPGLYTGNHAKDNAQVIKRRKLRLARPLEPANAQALSDQLHTVVGVKEVHAQGARLAIRYDLLQLTLPQIERAMEQKGFPLDNGWWHKWRRAWLRNTEANELDNLAMPAGACCNRPPPRI